MIILVDMDDVLEQLVVGWVAYVNDRYGTAYKAEHVQDWDMTKAMPDLTPDQIYGAIKDDHFWDYVKPIPGAQEALRKLIDLGHDVYIVTASDYESLQAKMDKVLFRYFPFLSWNQVIITQHKELIRGDVLIDDGPHNLVGGSYRKILFSAGHNQKVDETALGAVRVHNWEEALDEILKPESAESQS